MTQKKRQWRQYVGVCGMQTAARKGSTQMTTVFVIFGTDVTYCVMHNCCTAWCGAREPFPPVSHLFVLQAAACQLLPTKPRG